jgi:hypothetical protein
MRVNDDEKTVAHWIFWFPALEKSSRIPEEELWTYFWNR